MAGDTLALADEDGPEGAEALVRPVLRGGRRTGAVPTLEDARQRAADQLAALPPELARLGTQDYPVTVSQPLRDLAAEVDRRIDAGEQG
jgi:nicotinate phosphoribosyltransferase